jgi:formamidopyrimidine-DNA glycosylase
MPELPEVETVRRGLTPALVGRRIERMDIRRRDLRLPIPEGVEDRLTGRRIDALGRRAKFLLVDMSGGESLIVHLGMSGRFRVFAGTPPPPERHDHVIIAVEGGASVVFNDPRRFGMMVPVPTAEVESHPLLAGLGPEPLGAGFGAEVLSARLAGRRSPIKAVLLDQAVVAGLGNIYVCEALFRAGISPKRRADSIGPKKAARLASAIRDVLTEAIAAGGSSLRDHRQPSGELGYFQHRFAVYDRAGEPCPDCDCDPAASGGIRRFVQAGRSTFYCARRQR